ERDELLWSTFERMFRKGHDYNEERGSVEAWAKRIMTNIWYDLRARRAREPLTLVDDIGEELVAGPSAQRSEEADAVVWRLDIQRALVGLEDTKRALLMLVDYEGYPIVEAASMIDLKESNARFHLTSARRQLRAALGLGGDEPPTEPGTAEET
ncbi:MAG: RNA polymerase sigma factor, partial [Thermoleophilaceae bacterium]